MKPQGKLLERCIMDERKQKPTTLDKKSNPLPPPTTISSPMRQREPVPPPSQRQSPGPQERPDHSQFTDPKQRPPSSEHNRTQSPPSRVVRHPFSLCLGIKKPGCASSGLAAEQAACTKSAPHAHCFASVSAPASAQSVTAEHSRRLPASTSKPRKLRIRSEGPPQAATRGRGPPTSSRCSRDGWGSAMFSSWPALAPLCVFPRPPRTEAQVPAARSLHTTFGNAGSTAPGYWSPCRRRVIHSVPTLGAHFSAWWCTALGRF